MHSVKSYYYTTNDHTQLQADSFFNIVHHKHNNYLIRNYNPSIKVLDYWIIHFLFLQHTIVFHVPPNLNKSSVPLPHLMSFYQLVESVLFKFITSIFLLAINFLTHYNLFSDPTVTENFLRLPMTSSSQFKWTLLSKFCN